MEIVVQGLLWLGVSGIGAGLAAFAGRRGQVLGRHSRARRRPALLRLVLGLLLAWGLAVLAFTFYYSAWYALALGLAALAAFGAARADEEDEALILSQEQEKSFSDTEKLVAQYEALLGPLPGATPSFLDEAQLPAAKPRLAAALQTVYWARAVDPAAPVTRRELLRRYSALAYFIKAEDADFMNALIGFVQQKEQALARIKQDPERFILARERMNRIYQQVSEEQDRLLDEWYRAAVYFDED